MEDGPRVVIGASNLCIPPYDLMRYGAEECDDFLYLGHFDTEAGIEWTALRLPTAQRTAVSLAQRGLIKVVHESWREGRLHDVLGQRSLQGIVTESKVVAAFPLLDKSYPRLDRIQQASPSGLLPIIVHPGLQCLGDVLPRRPRWQQGIMKFSEVMFQPTAEWVLAKGMNPAMPNISRLADQMDDARAGDGLDRMVLGLHHFKAERMGAEFRDPIALAGELASRESFFEAQLELRPDFGGDPEEVRQVLRGNLRDTDLGRMLMAVNDSVPAGQTIRIVDEALPSVMLDMNENDETLGDIYARVNNSMRELMAV